MGVFDQLRARAFGVVQRVPRLARVNEALGRPLADEEELADRRAFATRSGEPKAETRKPKAESAAAPVIVYFMDKTRRDAQKLVDMLAAEGITPQLANIQEDPAAQMAVRRDSKGFRLPVVFIAGDVVGGRAELSNAISSGELKKKVFG